MVIVFTSLQQMSLPDAYPKHTKLRNTVATVFLSTLLFAAVGSGANHQKYVLR